MKKNHFGAYAHFALLILLLASLFSACNKSEKFTTQPNYNNLSGLNSAIINQVIPNGTTIVSFDSISKDNEAALTKMEATNTIIILSHGLSTNADKKFIKSVVRTYSIPVILNGQAAVNNNFVSHVSNIPGNSIALLYNRIGQGITTEIFNDKRFGTSKTISVKPALDPKRFVLTPSQKAEITKEALQKNPSLNIDSAWKEYYKNVAALLAQRTKNDTTAVSEEKIPDVPLSSQVEEMKSRFLECLSNVYKKEQQSNLAGNARVADVTSPGAHISDVATPDRKDYDFDSDVFNFTEPGTNNVSTLNNDGSVANPENGLIAFDYRVFVQVAKGTYPGSPDLRTFVNVTYVGNPGITGQIQDGDNKIIQTITPRFGSSNVTYQERSILNNMMALFQPAIDFPASFYLDSYQPLAIDVSSGSYSVNTASNININPVNPSSLGMPTRWGLHILILCPVMVLQIK